MLISFKISNFLSFDSPTTVSFLATSIKGEKDSTFLPPSLQWDYRLLRSIGVLGYNSAGKSNLLKGIGAMKYAVLYSGSSSGNIFLSSVVPFLLKTQSDKHSEFEVLFFLNNTKYRYGYKVGNGVVFEEWLAYAEPKVRENYLFLRSQKSINVNKAWNKENDNSIETLFKRVQDNTLFISVLGVLNVQPAVDILKWFQRIIVIDSFEADPFIDFTAEKLNDDVFRHVFTRILKDANIGFETIFEQKISNPEKLGTLTKDFLEYMLQNELLSKNRYDVLTIHTIFDNEGNKSGSIKFDLRTQESAGTKKFFGVIGLFLEAIANNRILLFDELDSRFHFGLYETLVQFFNDPKINPNCSQLLYTSHNTTILKGNKIRRDQLYSIKKSEKGSSLLERFHEKGNTLRTDASIEKEYQDRTLKKRPNSDFNLFSGLLDFPDQ
jgi:AAA15 family ATPase/GTPase